MFYYKFHSDNPHTMTQQSYHRFHSDIEFFKKFYLRLNSHILVRSTNSFSYMAGQHTGYSYFEGMK